MNELFWITDLTDNSTSTPKKEFRVSSCDCVEDTSCWWLQNVNQFIMDNPYDANFKQKVNDVKDYVR